MSQQSKADRIWELDALRGIAVLVVVLLHFLYDLQAFLGVITLDSPFIHFIMLYGGLVFILLSGLCATLGRRSFLRGLVVFGCGMVITLVTWVMAKMGMADEAIVVKFGVLHLLGICMMVWPLFRRLPSWVLVVLGILIIGLGAYVPTFRVEPRWLFPLGLRYSGFSSGDYFPLLPHLGWFFLGSVLGRTVYGKKQSLLPRFPSQAEPIRFFCWCGRQSLWIYLFHQPALYLIISCYAMIGYR